MDNQAVMELRYHEIDYEEGPLILRIAHDHHNDQLHKFQVLQQLGNHDGIEGQMSSQFFLWGYNQAVDVEHHRSCSSWL